MSRLTPMMKQYLTIKAQYKDAFLFFRLGDFYELFYEDAIQAARELEITLTKRDVHESDPIPMCGVPYHSAESYIKTLVDRGYKVAICEQVEDPKEAKGVVKREVVQVITPGTVMESSMLEDHESNYIAALSELDYKSYAVVYTDLSTGEIQFAKIGQDFDAVLHELSGRTIKEIVLSSTFPKELVEQLKDRIDLTISYEDEDEIDEAYEYLTTSLSKEEDKRAFYRLLHYLKKTQKRSLDHLQPIQIIELHQYLSLDMYSKRNLELTETILKKSKHGTLLWVLDQTKTAMGARTLRKWLERPLFDQKAIEKRLDLVEALINHFMERETIRDLLTSVYDLERLSGRIAFGNANARDLMQLRQSLEVIPELKSTLNQIDEEQIHILNHQIEYPEDIVQLLRKSIVDDPPHSITEGDIIRDGYHPQLDQYRKASKGGKEWIRELEQKEREKTNIRSLKIGYNRVFGYYIEVTRPNLALVPEDRYERKQTLTNAERFITPELKEKERLILEADEKSIELEYELFLEVREKIKKKIPQIQRLAEIISQLDCLQSFATVSEQNNYTRPTFSDQCIHIKKGRHPVIEKVLKDEMFVPNDIYLDENIHILLITGPNMSGKSTYMRQLALTVIMAQMGCFVPCDKAELFIFDQIFTRIGAADDLVQGKSTFMVEMLEANHAISHATDQSLILLDEIGRGTSTYDGMALAQAIIEYIHDHIHAKTLFSTHYHELTALEDKLEKLQNIHVRAEEYDGKVVFLHQIEKGAADKSYGIHVAQLANLPKALIERATDILEELENNSNQEIKEEHEQQDVEQLSLFVSEEIPNRKSIRTMGENNEKRNSILFEVLEELKKIDLLDTTPIEALNTLYELQRKIKEE